MTAAPAVEARGLAKRFENVDAVAHVDLTVGRGRIHGMLGPNGAGKTTLLAMLLGLVRPDAGTITLLGQGGPYRREGVGGFVESPRFYPYLSAAKNLALLAALDGRTGDGVGAVLGAVGLADHAGTKVAVFSLGMRQRLGVASALLRGDRLLLLDEPANGLDPAGARDLHAMLRERAAAGTAVVLSSHDMTEIEDICDDVTIMASGRVVFDGSIVDMRERAPDPVHRLRTSDDAAALAMAGQQDLRASRDDQGLTVHAGQSRLDSYVLTLGRAGVAVRALALSARPLQALFFSLTEDTPGTDPAPAVPEPVR